MQKKIVTLIFLLATVLWTVFIISNSLENSKESGNKSSRVQEVVQTVADSIGIEVEVSAFVIRKTAHFTEFFVLSGLFLADFYLILIHRRQKKPSKIALSLSYAPILALMVAVADELAQSFSPGRHSSPVDVLIDFSGALFAYLLFFGVLLVIGHIKEKKMRQSD